MKPSIIPVIFAVVILAFALGMKVSDLMREKEVPQSVVKVKTTMTSPMRSDNTSATAPIR